MKVFKYEFPIRDHFELELPRFAQILSVQEQKGKACMWALVDDQMDTVTRDFMVFGTGHNLEEPLNGELKYISTLQLVGGSFVCHLFEHVR